MPSFEAGDVIKVPSPYTDRATRQHRPALVVSVAELEKRHGLLWVLMITSAENRSWPGDIALADLARAGLPAPSVIRTAKIATIDAADAEKLGNVGKRVRDEVLVRVAATLRIRPAPEQIFLFRLVEHNPDSRFRSESNAPDYPWLAVARDAGVRRRLRARSHMELFSKDLKSVTADFQPDRHRRERPSRRRIARHARACRRRGSSAGKPSSRTSRRSSPTARAYGSMSPICSRSACAARARRKRTAR